MIAAGIKAWHPRAVVLDLRKLQYQWGDDMARIIATAGTLNIGVQIPCAVVVSELNREGLTSLISFELLSDPNEWLFESPEEAIEAIDKAYVEWLAGR